MPRSRGIILPNKSAVTAHQRRLPDHVSGRARSNFHASIRSRSAPRQQPCVGLKRLLCASPSQGCSSIAALNECGKEAANERIAEPNCGGLGYIKAKARYATYEWPHPLFQSSGKRKRL